MKVELLYFGGCPNAPRARSLISRCLAGARIDVPIIERVGPYPSPTILIDGADVMGAASLEGPSCRLDLPTEAQLLAAILRAASEATP